MAPVRHKNIRWLDVAVDDPPRVRHIQTVSDLNRQVEQCFNLEGLAFDTVLQRLPLQQLHGNKGLTLVLVNVMNGADVGMIQGRGGARFAPESRQGLRVSGQLLRQKLQRQVAAQPGVERLVHHPHPAAPQLLQNAIVRNRLAHHAGSRIFQRFS